MSVPHPIPYQGSKRALASAILSYFPPNTNRLVEPFAGSAAISLAAAYHRKASRFLLNDTNPALMSLWWGIINEPESIAREYRKLWEAQLGQERGYYDLIRQRFNTMQRPDHFLYLLARCVKASVRYNSYGEFNQSPDNRRKGTNPVTMRAHVVRASRLLANRTQIMCRDYLDVLRDVKRDDVVYMDPPYQGVCGERDQRYISKVAFDVFVEALRNLNDRKISYILSYDGRTGSKRYGRPLPKNLTLMHIEVDAGRSTQSTLLGRNARTYESIYLSPSLAVVLEKLTPTKQLLESQEQLMFAEA